MYTVFICRKCEHELYVKDVENMGKELGEIAVMDCPNCGEEGYDNWILSCRKRYFPGEEKTCGQCSHFLGMGDWNLCCDIRHPTPKEKEHGEYFPCGHLCYEDTEACDEFNEKECET